jgi:hypothetical protein
MQDQFYPTQQSIGDPATARLRAWVAAFEDRERLMTQAVDCLCIVWSQHCNREIAPPSDPMLRRLIGTYGIDAAEVAMAEGAFDLDAALDLGEDMQNLARTLDKCLVEIAASVAREGT